MRVIGNSYTRYFDDHRGDLAPFPAQIGRSMADGAFHLGAGPDQEGIDFDRECYPAGQGTGAIGGLVPAGELVRRFVEEAEAVLSRLESARK
jgi:enoyl-[acyl-carrier protein] reductase II